MNTLEKAKALVEYLEPEPTQKDIVEIFKALIAAEKVIKLYANPDTWDADSWGVMAINSVEYGDPGGKARDWLKEHAKESKP